MSCGKVCCYVLLCRCLAASCYATQGLHSRVPPLPVVCLCRVLPRPVVCPCHREPPQALGLFRVLCERERAREGVRQGGWGREGEQTRERERERWRTREKEREGARGRESTRGRERETDLERKNSREQEGRQHVHVHLRVHAQQRVHAQKGCVHVRMPHCSNLHSPPPPLCPPHWPFWHSLSRLLLLLLLLYSYCQCQEKRGSTGLHV